MLILLIVYSLMVVSLFWYHAGLIYRLLRSPIVGPKTLSALSFYFAFLLVVATLTVSYLLTRISTS